MNEKTRLTIFTPTYNRGSDRFLGKCYSDLQAQTCKDFIWLIIDDGSTDGTEEYIKRLTHDAGFAVQYVYKKNGGTHSGYNKAFELCRTELICCFETDDEMRPEAVEVIMKESRGELFDRNLGLISTARYIDKDEIIGLDIPKKYTAISYNGFYYRKHGYGDKFFVYKMSAIKEYRFPEYEGEKLCSTAAMLLTVHGRYKVIREDIYRKAYLEDGYTKNGSLNYVRSPKGFAYFHAIKLKEVKDLRTRLKSAVHYTACSMLAGDRRYIAKSPDKLLTLITYPAGLLWYGYLVRLKAKSCL